MFKLLLTPPDLSGVNADWRNHRVMGGSMKVLSKFHQIINNILSYSKRIDVFLTLGVFIAALETQVDLKSHKT